jgi:transcriptional regulator with XRE-family HTH domain
MTEIAHPIDLNLPVKLQDRHYREQFFLAEASAHLAEQIITLRKRRNLNQKRLAELTDTKQPAISRVEQADYQNWSFSTLRKIVAALDARIRVTIEASEDVLVEYEENQTEFDFRDAPLDMENASQGAMPNLTFLLNGITNSWNTQSWLGRIIPFRGASDLNVQLAEKDAEIARLKAENKILKCSVTVQPHDYQVMSPFNPVLHQAQLGWGTEVTHK